MVFPPEDPRLSSVLVSMLDMTERKRAEDALRVSQAQKGAVIELALDGVIVIDEQGYILEFNRAAERIFGFTAEEMVGGGPTPPLCRRAEREGLGAGCAAGCCAARSSAMPGVRRQRKDHN